MRLDRSSAPREPLELLERWVTDAREARLPEPASVAFVTVGDGGRPTARTVSLKRVEPDALLFSSALWTRKARELQANPHVALLFHWPSLARQVQVAGEARSPSERWPRSCSASATSHTSCRRSSHARASRSRICSRCTIATHI